MRGQNQRRVATALVNVRLHGQEGLGEVRLLIDAEGRCRDATPAALALLGRAREALPTLRVSDLVVAPPGWLEEQLPAFARAGIWRGELTLRRPDGSTVVVEASAALLPRSDRERWATAGIGGVAGGEGAQTPPPAADARFQALARNLPDGLVLLFDQDLRFTDVEGSGPVAAELQNQRLIGHTVQEALEPWAATPLAPLCRAALAGQTSESEARLAGRAHVLRVVPLRDPSGAIGGGMIIGQDVSARRHVEIELARALAQESAARAEAEAARRQLASFLESISDGFFTLDREWRYTYVNRSGALAVNSTPEQLVGRVIWETYPSAVGTTFERVYRHVMETGEVTAFQDYFPQLDSWYEGTVYPNEHGITIFFRNVTDRVRADEALRASERRYRTVVEQSWDLVGFLGPDGSLLYQSPSFTRVLGYPRDALLGRSPLELVHPDDVARAGREFAAMIAAKSPGTATELRIRHADGSWRWLQAVSTNLLGDPAVGAVVVHMRDVSEQKRAEEALRASEERFRSLAEQAEDVIYRYDLRPALRVSYINPAITRLLGYTPEEYYADPQLAVRVVHPEDRRALEERRQRQQAGEPFGETPFRVRWRAKDGRTVWMDSRTIFVRDAAGAPTALQGVARDVTRRVRDELSHEILYEIDRLILADAPLDEILDLTCRKVAHAFDLELVWIGLKQADGAVSIRAAAGAARSYADGLVIRWDDRPEGQGPTGRAIRGEESRLVDVEHDPSYAPWRARALAHGLRTSLALPLAAKGSVLGAISVYAVQPAVLDEAVTSRLRGIASQLALSLDAAERREQLRLQGAALEAAANAIVVTDRRGLIRWVNPAFERLSGYTAEEVIGGTPRIVKSGTHPERFYRQLWETILGGAIWQGELINRRKDGSLYTEEMTISPVRDLDASVSHFVAIKQDVSARKRQEEELKHLATHDALTDLPNRRALGEALTRAVEQARRGRVGALLLLDIDNFKVVNDTVGHATGDRLLCEVAALLRAALRPTDLLARLGGDEFAAVLHDTDREIARAVAERLRARLDAHRFPLEQHVFTPTTSVGMVLIGGELPPERLLAVADAALFRAKDLGRNRVVVFRAADVEQAGLAEAGRWATRVRDALRDDRFVLVFQPIVRLSDERVEHYESLLRLRDDDGRMVPPAEFLPAAERFGLMPRIDRWVLQAALRLLRAQRRLQLFVNLSGASLGDAALLDEIEAVVAGSRLGPMQLTFEITESVAMGDPGHARRWMQRLKQVGCRFALDDFGSGFSSFAYLQALPADFVKIDGSFVRAMDTNPTNRALVAAITSVAHALGKEAIAECVEQAAVAQALRDLGVEYGQGYYWARPGPLPPTPS